MAAPPGLASTSVTAKNHSAEAHRHEERGSRNVLLQCAKCGAIGTQYGRAGVKVLAVTDGRAALVATAWRRHRAAQVRGDEQVAQHFLRITRDLRSGKPLPQHSHCGGLLVGYDIGVTSA